jgi:cyanophycinase
MCAARSAPKGLDTVDVRDGLGLAPFAVDLHAAQAGTVSRAVAAVAAGLMEWAVAIDDNTAAVLSRRGDEDYEVIGSGNCWDIRLTGCGTTVSVRSAGGLQWRCPALEAGPG